MKDRILHIMEREGLTPSRFAETIGIQRSAMSHIISGRNNPSLDVLMKILERFTYIQSDWLLFGKGNMERDQQIKEPDLFDNTPLIPAKVQIVSENRREMGVKSIPNPYKQVVNEDIIPVKTENKSVTKIMIFYSDNTYDTFIPEKK